MKTLILLALTLTAAFATSSAHADYTELSNRIAMKRLSLALLIAEAYDKGGICEAEAYPSEIMREISSARYNVSDAIMKKFIARINPKSELHANLAFREATGQVAIYNSEISEAELTKGLLGTKYYRFGQGAYGSGYNVTLQAKGVASENTLEVLNDAPWTKWHKSTTTWKLVRDDKAPFVGFYLQIGGDLFELNNETQGDLLWVLKGTKQGDTEYFHRTLSSSDSYCDA